jgi:primase-polymerase (primpol)-like protein
MTVDSDAIPAVLREYPQWVCWRAQERNGKLTKVPIDPHTRSFASVSDPDTWTHYELAVGVASVEDGLGFVFTDDDPFLGVDLDDCREHGELTAWARDIVDRLDSYTEISPSGEGVHVLIEGDIPSTKSRRGDVECYDADRFFTMTGDQLAETPDRIESRQDAFVRVYDQYVYSDSESPEEARNSPREPTTSLLPDDELLERAMDAKNGEKFERLWHGSTLGYESHSEADMALCCLLAFWTGNDATRIDDLFRDSRLYRDKWDEVHYADGSTYGEKTVARAIDLTNETYDDSGGTRDNHSSTVDSKARSRAPVNAVAAERIQVLTDRVATLERQLTAIQADIDQLNTSESTSRTQDTHAKATSPTEPEVDRQTSLWGSLRRRFRN